MNPAGTTSVEYLGNRKWIPHCSMKAGKGVDDNFEVLYDDIPMISSGTREDATRSEVPDAADNQRVASKADSDSCFDSNFNSASGSNLDWP